MCAQILFLSYPDRNIIFDSKNFVKLFLRKNIFIENVCYLYQTCLEYKRLSLSKHSKGDIVIENNIYQPLFGIGVSYLELKLHDHIFEFYMCKI